MRFWEASALLALVAEQHSGLGLESAMSDDTDAVIWWATPVEVTSGLCRLQREGQIDSLGFVALERRARKLYEVADEVGPSEEVRIAALRMLRVHALRAADAMQLAAALCWTSHRPAGAEFLCLDRRLREAAQKEGFTVLPESM